MALSTPTIRHQSKSAETFGTGAFTTASFTPSNNSLLAVCVSGISESNDGMTGADLTMTPSTGSATLRVTSPTGPNWAYGHKWFTIPITTGSSMTIQVDCGAFNIHQYGVEVYEFTGHDTSTPTGATATGTDADGDGAASITLSASPASTSIVLAKAQIALGGAGAPGVTQGSGFTELYDNLTASWSLDHAQYRGSSTSTTVDWVDLATVGGVAVGATLTALEIKEATGGGGVTLKSLMLLGVGS